MVWLQSTNGVTTVTLFTLVVIILLYAYRYDSEGKAVSMSSVSSGLSPSTKSGSRSMYSDRISLSHILENKSLGEEKVTYNLQNKESENSM